MSCRGLCSRRCRLPFMKADCFFIYFYLIALCWKWQMVMIRQRFKAPVSCHLVQVGNRQHGSSVPFLRIKSKQWPNVPTGESWPHLSWWILSWSVGAQTPKQTTQTPGYTVRENELVPGTGVGVTRKNNSMNAAVFSAGKISFSRGSKWAVQTVLFK